MTHTAASHQGATEMIWLLLCRGPIVSSIVLQSPTEPVNETVLCRRSKRPGRLFPSSPDRASERRQQSGAVFPQNLVERRRWTQETAVRPQSVFISFVKVSINLHQSRFIYPNPTVEVTDELVLSPAQWREQLSFFLGCFF